MSQLLSGASACLLALAVFPARPGLLGVLAIEGVWIISPRATPSGISPRPHVVSFVLCFLICGICLGKHQFAFILSLLGPIPIAFDKFGTFLVHRYRLEFWVIVANKAPELQSKSMNHKIANNDKCNKYWSKE